MTPHVEAAEPCVLAPLGTLEPFVNGCCPVWAHADIPLLQEMQTSSWIFSAM